MSGWLRSLRVFIKALRMTLSGDAIQTAAQRYPILDAWVKQGVSLVDTAFKVADETGMNEQARKDYNLMLDKRNISMQTILALVKHNLTLEYPLLMEARIEHNLTTLYALNMNDQYYVASLVESLNNDNLLKQTVIKLSEHLNEIPNSNLV